ncbi:hypothetical protein IFM89_032423 [Coptis chinensis]|uniref:Vesicle transport protein USE1 n=1 Tax=Coptis chinensis TaxID=261450 RepID=A0A835LX21_9MAGN|nr:hypothetical protein IFM89_032423 [Coptis chinensis]
MGSKTEINLNRLLTAAPRQQNQTKLMHYVATLRELLEQLVEETTPEGLPRISKAKENYSEKIEALATKLAAPPSMPRYSETVDVTGDGQIASTTEEKTYSPPVLRRRLVSHPKVEDVNHEITEADPSAPVKLDDAAHSHIEKHRKLQDDLTDEMVGLARQLKESSLMMNQSLQDTEKVARASAVTVGVVYGTLKLKYLKAKAKSHTKAEAKAHH